MFPFAPETPRHRRQDSHITKSPLLKATKSDSVQAQKDWTRSSEFLINGKPLADYCKEMGIPTLDGRIDLKQLHFIWEELLIKPMGQREWRRKNIWIKFFENWFTQTGELYSAA